MFINFLPKRIFIGFTCLILAQCAPIKILNFNLPQDSYSAIKNVPYAKEDRGRFDLYIPKNRTQANAMPTIIWIYGGSWKGGHKQDYAFVGHWFANKGYNVVIPDYRVYPSVRFPDFLYDNAKAIKAALGHSALSGSSGDIILTGHSAGAYNAAMLSYDPKYLRSVGINASKNVKAFIGLAGPYDFYPYEIDTTKQVFGHIQNPEVTQPYLHVTKLSPSTLLLHGLKDDLVYPKNSRTLESALKKKGVPVTLVEYLDKTHVTLLTGLSTIAPAPEIQDVMVEFLNNITY